MKERIVIIKSIKIHLIRLRAQAMMKIKKVMKTMMMKVMMMMKMKTVKIRTRKIVKKKRKVMIKIQMMMKDNLNRSKSKIRKTKILHNNTSP